MSYPKKPSSMAGSSYGGIGTVSQSQPLDMKAIKRRE